MFDQPACSPLARPSSTAQSTASKPAALAALSARFPTDEPMDYKLPGKHGQGRSQQAAPPHFNFGIELVDSPDSEIAKIEEATSTSRPLCITASSRYLGETMDSFDQLKFEAGHNKPLRRTSASSWQTGHSSKEATNFEEAPPTDHSARQRGRHQGFRGPTARPRREEAREFSNVRSTCLSSVLAVILYHGS